MEKNQKQKTRRSFIRKVTLSTAVVSASSQIFANSYNQKINIKNRIYSSENHMANDQINLA